MNPQIEERIGIINQLKTTLTGKDLSLEKRIKRLKLWGYMNFGLVNLLLVFLIIISASTLLRLEPFGQNWQKSGLIVLMTISLSLHAHFSIIEFLLLKHSKRLGNSDFNFDNRLNMELKELINDMNYHRFKPYWIIIPAIILMIASALMFLELNPYWDMFTWPVLAISVLLSWRLNNCVFLIRRNIENLGSRVVIN
ncbi:MAG TPA: hypothetical protein VF373_06270 [Prolixibacteraceae bacterium]